MRRKNNKFFNQNIIFFSFIFVLCLGFLMHIITPAKVKSEEENRNLAQFPVFTWEKIVKGKISNELEEWFTDQFPARNALVNSGNVVKSFVSPKLKLMKENIVLIDAHTDMADIGNVDGLIDEEPVTPVPTQAPLPHGGENPAQTNTEKTEITTAASRVTPTPTKGAKPPEEPHQIASSNGIMIIDGKAMERFYGNAEKLAMYAKRINHLAKQVPGVKTYNMFIPTSIEFNAPEEFHSGNRSQKKSTEIVGDNLDSGVTQVKIYDNLLAHRDEYLYFRTDHHWTALGAYYAYESFARTAGLEPAKLDDLEHYQLEGTYLGSLYRYTKKNPIVKKNADTVEGWRTKFEYTATAWDKGDMKSSYPTRLNDERIKGGNSYLNFSGGDRALLDIQTSNKNGRKIVVVKDSFGNAFVPYLVNNFERICVFDPRYYKKDLIQFIRDNEITDVLVMNYAFASTNKGWNSKFSSIINYK